MEGVDSVEVSLNEGLARISLEPGNQLSLDSFRKVVENNGFTPREARVTALGEVVSSEGRLNLRVAADGETYQLVRGPEARKSQEELMEAIGVTVVAEGEIPPPSEVGGRFVLQWLDFQPAEQHRKRAP